MRGELQPETLKQGNKTAFTVTRTARSYVWPMTQRRSQSCLYAPLPTTEFNKGFWMPTMLPLALKLLQKCLSLLQGSQGPTANPHFWPILANWKWPSFARACNTFVPT